METKDIEKDCQLAAKVLDDMSEFETGQDILLDAARRLNTLEAENAALREEVARLRDELIEASNGEFIKARLHMLTEAPVIAAPLDPELQALIDRAKVYVRSLTSEEREAMWVAQRDSWVRGEMELGLDKKEAAERP